MDERSSAPKPHPGPARPGQPWTNPLLGDAERARAYAQYAHQHFEHVQGSSDRLVAHAERVIATAGALAAFTAVFVPDQQLTALNVGDWRSLLLLAVFVLLTVALLLGVFALRLRRQKGYPPVYDLQFVFANAALDIAGVHKRVGDALLEAAAFNTRLNASRAGRLRWASLVLLLALLLTLVRVGVAGNATSPPEETGHGHHAAA